MTRFSCRVGLGLALSVATITAGCEPVEHVPDDAPIVEATLRCLPRDGGELLGVSPTGDLWLATASGTRIVDLLGGDRTLPASLADATAVQPWNGEDATFVQDGALWSWRGGEREAVALPPELGAVRAWCGAPDDPRGTFVATEHGIFERDGAWWWQWSAGDTPLPPGTRLLSIDGACSGKDDTTWFTTEGDELWKVSATDAGPATDARDLRELVGHVAGMVARFGDTLRAGPDWRAIELEAGAVSAVGGSYRRLWVAAGDGVFVRHDFTWQRVGGLPAAPPTAIAAHATAGAWLLYDDEVCHAALAAPVIIRGLRPLERRLERTVDLELTLPGQPDQDATIERDGEPLAVAAVSDGAAAVPELALGAAGWHRLEVHTADQAHRLDYYIEPGATRSWAADIEPLFQSYCAGGACHGPTPDGNRPDLSTYDSWKTRAPRIRTRLLAGTMPPVDPRPSAAELDTILEWIEGGTPP